MFFEPKNGHGLPHNPISACVAPRPIGWISSISDKGIPNLAPFSYFNLVHNFPPTVMFACNGLKPDGSPKDSRVNAETTGEFVYNVATMALKEHVNLSSTTWPDEVDEFEKVGLTPIASSLVSAPRVKESPIQFECKTIRIIHLPTTQPQNPNTLIFGEVVGVHIDETVLVDGLVNYKKVGHLSRLGYLDFGNIGDIFEMPRVYHKEE